MGVCIAVPAKRGRSQDTARQAHRMRMRMRGEKKIWFLPTQLHKCTNREDFAREIKTVALFYSCTVNINSSPLPSSVDAVLQYASELSYR